MNDNAHQGDPIDPSYVPLVRRLLEAATARVRKAADGGEKAAWDAYRNIRALLHPHLPGAFTAPRFEPEWKFKLFHVLQSGVRTTIDPDATKRLSPERIEELITLFQSDAKLPISYEQNRDDAEGPVTINYTHAVAENGAIRGTILTQAANDDAPHVTHPTTQGRS